MHKLVHGLNHLYKSDKSLFVAAILNFLKINPILVFQLIIFFRWPSLATAVMVLVGGLSSHVSINIFYMLILINNKTIEKTGTYDSIPGCEFHPYSVRDFLNDETYEDLDKHLIKSFTPFDFDKIVKIYRVYQPGALRANLQCFAAPLFGADIFISDKPSETRGIQRLFVLHEIGHSLLRMASLDYAAILRIRPFLFFLLWVSFSIQWDRNSAFVFAAYILSMLAWREDWKRSMELIRLNDEILADGFAFCHIDTKDIERIARGKSFPGLIDPDMKLVHNLIRMTKFRDYLGLALEGKTDDILTDAFQLLPKPQLLPLTAAVAITSILGCYAPAPSAATLYWSVSLLVFLVVLLFIITIIRSAFVDSFDSLLRSRRLDSRVNPIPEPPKNEDVVRQIITDD